jgi:hypothetical protein
MHSDFYNFAREPDPLYSTNLVQQLLSYNDMASNTNPSTLTSGNEGSFANSGMETNRHFNGQHHAFRPGHDHAFSNSHVEASQILQALSSASERQNLSQVEEHAAIT